MKKCSVFAWASPIQEGWTVSSRGPEGRVHHGLGHRTTSASAPGREYGPHALPGLGWAVVSGRSRGTDVPVGGAETAERPEMATRRAGRRSKVMKLL